MSAVSRRRRITRRSALAQVTVGLAGARQVLSGPANPDIRQVTYKIVIGSVRT